MIETLSARIKRAVQIKFPGSTTRVIDCFERFDSGEELDVLYGDGTSSHNRQKANCWVKGLTTIPFHDIKNGKFDWALELEKSHKIVEGELEAFLQMESATKTENWSGPRFQGQHYGPEWRVLGLQDRGIWDGENVEHFPQTVQLLKNLKVPSCEAFFARQGPHSGIQPHSDLNNFILTSHLAVIIPEGQCWIRVGDETRYWETGKVMAFDTSFFHSTRNDADTDRFVLLIRFWHPDLSDEEVKAFTFIFDYLDVAALGEEALAAFEFDEVYGPRSLSQSSQEFRNEKGNESQNTISSGESRQMRRERERKEKKGKVGVGAKGFHRGK